MTRRFPPLRFLVVEDESLIAMDLIATIEDSGHAVVAEATSLRDVRNLDDDLAPDVAFIDLHLAEGSSGLDVSAVVRRRWPAAIVVIVTANPRKLVDHHDHAHGCIAKPFSRSGLMTTLRYVSDGICNPPPAGPIPPNFTAFPGLATTWTG